ncbi:uncharacterized protein KZ484_011851 isoform 2-T2 [Pholidichthys leucotaenia]
MTSVSKTESHRWDVPQQNYFNQEEVLVEQQLLNQERNFIVQVGADCSQIKEEEQNICISQEGEQFGLKQETQTSDEEQHVNENEFSPDQQLCNQEENSGLKQDEPERDDPPQMKEEQVGEQEADTFTLTLIPEENQQSEAEPNREQRLSHHSAGTESQDEEGSRHVDSGNEEPKPKKRRVKTRSHHEDFPEQHVNENEFSPDQQLWNQEENSGLEQDEAERDDPPQMKGEQVGEQEADTFTLTLIPEENQQSEAEPNREQRLSHHSAGTDSQDEEGSRHVDSENEEPKPKKRRVKTRSHHEDFPEQHVNENEFSPDQQLWNQEENSGLEQDEPERDDPPQMKGEQVGEQEADTFTLTLIPEENQQNEAEPNREQRLSHHSAGTESQDEEGSRHVDSENEEPKPKKRRVKTRSHHEDFPEQHVNENEFSPDQQLWNQEENSGLEQDEPERDDPPQMKGEQVGEQEADTFTLTLIPEENQQSEAEPNREQRLSHHSAGTESQDEEGSRHVDSGNEEPKPKKRRVTTRSHHEDFPEQHVNENEFSPDQQLWNQEENSGLEQDEPERDDPPQMKGEQVGEQDSDTFTLTLIPVENQQSEAEPNREQRLSHHSAGTESQDEEGSRHVDSGNEEPKPKKRRVKTRSHHEEVQRMMDCQHRLLDFIRKPVIKLHRIDAPQLHDCKEEEEEDILTIQQLCDHERNSILDQEKQDATQVKEEELCTSQEEEHFGLKQETDTFMATPTDEDNDNNEAELKGEQLLSKNSPDTESQDQGAGKNVYPGSNKHEESKLKKRLRRKRSDRNNVDNIMSENQCDTDTREKSVNCSVNVPDCKMEFQHKKPHTVDKPHACNMCGKRFRWRNALSVHRRIHTGENPFSCETCGQSFNRSYHLKSHTRTHTGEKPFSCETCRKRFKHHSTLKTHMRIHTGEKPFSCETCGQSFYQHGNWKSHMRVHTCEKPFFCETCRKRFKHHSTLKTHIRIHTGEKAFSCETCGKIFNHHLALRTHMRIHTGEKPFCCETCGKSFNQHGNLKTHVRIHTGEKPFSCETCGQSFNRSDLLKTHLRIHTCEKPFSCETCRKRFKHHCALKTHMRIHTGEKPFSCETCGQSFNRSDHLKSHLRIHTCEKPFSCETCRKRFKHHCALKTHMRIHTGEKPFSCETCGQSFNQYGNLKTHMRIHTGEKPFSCKTCGQSFVQYGHLKTHIRIHTGEKL